MTTSVAERVAQIRSGPAGDKVAAFFDYDGTLIRGYSAATHVQESLRRRELGPGQLMTGLRTALLGICSERDFAAALDSMAPAITGRTTAELDELGSRLFRDQIARVFRHDLWPVLAAHREMGHLVVVASSATPFQVEPAAREVDADAVLCTRLEVVDGRYTGRTEGRPLWGPGKAAAVRRLARERGVVLAESYAYSDGDEDVPFLQSVGHPAAVSPGRRLRQEAAAHGWTVFDLAAPRRPPVPVTVARTAAYYASVSGALAAGTVAAALRRQPALVTGHVLPLGNELGLRLAGLDVDVVSGKEHLTEARPCVFVFNHQSKLDGQILLSLLGGRQLAGVAKAEIGRVPGIGRFLTGAGVVYVERSDSARARAAVEPLVAKLRDERVSVVLAPEGTRMATPRLGPFKTGAFHLAMQAGVPVVPVVIRNAAELQWRGGVLLNPGTIEVAVLPPVDSAGWRPETVRAHAAEVRDMFVTTLADWPGRNDG
jgi:putative phosphoserine phosphatase/1-acylglycerol-3-phosphate O-acyltransferase